MPKSGQNRQLFVPWDLEIWWMTLKNNRAPLLCYFNLCVSFHSYLWIQTGVTVQKWPILVNRQLFVLWDLEIWWLTLKNNRAPLLCYLKLWASFHSYLWIQTRVYPETHQTGAKFVLTSVTLTLTFCMDIHDDMIMETKWKRCDRQTDRQTDGQMDRRTGPFIELLGCS